MSDFQTEFLPQVTDALEVYGDPFELRNWSSRPEYFEILTTEVLETLHRLTLEQLVAGSEFSELQSVLDRILMKRYLLSSEFEKFLSFTSNNGISVPSPLREVIENGEHRDETYHRQLDLLNALVNLASDDDPFAGIRADIGARFFSGAFVNIAVKCESAADHLWQGLTFPFKSGERQKIRARNQLFQSAQNIDLSFRDAAFAVQNAMVLADDAGTYFYELKLDNRLIANAEVPLTGRSAGLAIGWLAYQINAQIVIEPPNITSFWGVFDEPTETFRPVDGLKAKLQACWEDGIRVIVVPAATLSQPIEDGLSFSDYARQMGMELSSFSDDAPFDEVYQSIRREFEERSLIPTSTSQALRYATVLFIDLDRSTPFDAAKVERYNGIVQKTVARYGGRYDGQNGNRIQASFGTVAPFLNDPEWPLRAALEIRNAVAKDDLAVKVGIDTGMVSVTSEGQVLELEENSLISRASQLQQQARAGEIWVGRQTHHATRRTSAFQFEFKPSAKAYTVSETDALDEDDIKEETLIDRKQKMAEFQVCIDALRAGKGQIVDVIGVAGIGKTALMAEIRKNNTDSDLTWLEGHCPSLEQAYSPFRQLIRADAGISFSDDAKESLQKLKRRITSLFDSEVEQILPYLANLAGIEVSADDAQRLRHLDAEEMGHHIFRASLLFFSRLANWRPLVLVFEDLHWADLSSMKLLEHLLPLVRSVPLLICSVSRPYDGTQDSRLREIVPQDFDGDYYTKIRLEPLEPHYVDELACKLLEIDNLLAGVRPLVQKAEGIPFFAQQIILWLKDNEVIVRDEETGEWRIKGKLDALVVPETIAGLILERFNRLSPDTQEVARIATVIGQRFSEPLLQEICGTESRVLRHLAQLLRLQFIRRNPVDGTSLRRGDKGTEPDKGDYTFNHALTQTAIYQTISDASRKEIHRRVGQAIETLFADREDEFYAALAYHYAQAEDLENAKEYLLKAGDWYDKVAANAEALELYLKAMEVCKQVFGERWPAAEQATLERKIGEIYYRLGDYKEAAAHLESALSLQGNSLPVSGGKMRLAIARQLLKQIWHRLLPFLLPKQKSDDAVDDDVKERIRIYRLMAWIGIFIDPQRLLLLAFTGLNLAEREGFSLGIAYGSSGLGTICDIIPIFGLAKKYHHRAVEVSKQAQNPDATGLAYNGLAAHMESVSELQDAIELFDRASDAWTAGHLRHWGFATGQVAVLYHHKGEFGKSLKLMEEVVQVSEEIGDNLMWGAGLNVKGLNLLRLGRLDEATTCLELSLEKSKTVPSYSDIAYANISLGACHLYRGEIEKALEFVYQANATIEEHDVRIYRTPLLRTYLAWLLLNIVEKLDGSEEGRKSREEAKVICKETLQTAKHFRVPQVHWLLGTYKWVIEKNRKAAQKHWRKSLEVLENLKIPWYLGITHLEMGKRLEAREHLGRAFSIFTEIGAKLDAEEARKALEALS